MNDRTQKARETVSDEQRLCGETSSIAHSEDDRRGAHAMVDAYIDGDRIAFEEIREWALKQGWTEIRLMSSQLWLKRRTSSSQ